jgi:hypothetical protein
MTMHDSTAEDSAPLPGRVASLPEMARRISASWNDAMSGPETCLERLRQQVLSDRVAFYFNVTARQQDGQLVLDGQVERPEFREITRALFQHLGHAAVVDRLEVVPDLQSDPAPFGVAAAPHVLTWSGPQLTGLAMDEALLGEPLYLLKELPGAWLIKTFTGYWGYARKDEVRRVSREAFVRLLNGPRALVLEDAQAGELRLPAGSRLPIRHWGRGETCLLGHPAAGEVNLPKRLCQRLGRRREVAHVVEQARMFLGSPYQMGGKNRETGIDCSGLVQLSYRAIGLSLPRDAKQQYLGGYLVLPCAREALLPGDALYFMNAAGQVDHTGLYLGHGEMIHASSPAVRLQSLDRSAPNYYSRFDQEFLGAKRFCW